DGGRRREHGAGLPGRRHGRAGRVRAPGRAVHERGNYEAAPLAEVTEDMWDRTVDTHLKGTFFCVQASEPALRATRGCVVTMASDAGLLGFRGGWAAYCAAMGGVVNLTRQLAVDLAPEVRVNALAPGPVGTQ